MTTTPCSTPEHSWSSHNFTLLQTPWTSRDKPDNYITMHNSMSERKTHQIKHKIQHSTTSLPSVSTIDLLINLICTRPLWSPLILHRSSKPTSHSGICSICIHHCIWNAKTLSLAHGSLEFALDSSIHASINPTIDHNLITLQYFSPCPVIVRYTFQQLIAAISFT